MTDQQTTTTTRGAQELLQESLAKRILILDGAMGTMIQRRGLSETQFRVRASQTTRPISRATTICSP